MRCPSPPCPSTQVAVALNGEDFVFSTLGTAQYSFYPQTVTSIEPAGGSFYEYTVITVSGFFFPGFDGLESSARCKFGNQLSTPTLLEAKEGIIVCSSPTRETSDARTDAGGPGYEDLSFSVALNTVDFVGNDNITFRFYDHFLASISPQGGHLQGNTLLVLLAT